MEIGLRSYDKVLDLANLGIQACTCVYVKFD